MDFIFVTKAAGDWVAYLFESISFKEFPLSMYGLFEIAWPSRGGQTPGLSHASIYGRLTDLPQKPTPLPGTLALLGLGLAEFGIARHVNNELRR